MTSMIGNYVKQDIFNHVAHIEFFTEQSNSLPSSILRELATTITAAGNNDEVKLIVLRSGGEKTFCAGASFDELSSISNIENGTQFFMGFANVILAIKQCPKIVIGRIHGKAVGGGVGLASAVDYCMATKYSTFRLSELAVGIGPFVIGPAVERKIGMSAYSKLSLTPDEWQTAEWGKQQNLYHEVFDTIEQLDAYIQHFSEKLSAYNPAALQELKKVFWEGTGHWNSLLSQRAEVSGKLVLSDFTKQSIARFKKA